MGFETGDDGRIVKYSDLFDYSSEETLKASLYLPTANNNLHYQIADVTKRKNKSNFDATNLINRYFQLDLLSKTSNDQNLINIFNGEKIRVLAELLIDSFDFYDNVLNSPKNKKGEFTMSVDYNDITIPEELRVARLTEIIKLINKHNNTKISTENEQAATKVSISASIGNIVLDLRNMDLAYSPITMQDLSKIADESKKGLKVAKMSMVNPLTKYIMLVQNMVGKKVIGIAAVGEKVFFNLSYYWNEGIRSNNETWIKNLQFSKNYSRVDGRYKFSKSGEGLNSVVKTKLANVNFEGNLHLVEKFKSSLAYAIQLRKLEKYSSLTDNEINNDSSELVNAYKKELSDYVKANSNKLEAYADLIISLVLSAATDNAKELILDKINCGDNLAKCYLHMIMLGFDIKDIVSFMTSPAVSLVNDFTEANMMDSYVYNVSLDDALLLAQGYINPLKFITGKISESREDDYGNIITTEIDRTDDFARLIKESSSLKNISFGNAEKLSDIIKLYIFKKIENPNLPKLKYCVTSTPLFNMLSDYVDKVANLIKNNIDNYVTTGSDYVKFKETVLLPTEDEFKLTLDLDNKLSEGEVNKLYNEYVDNRVSYLYKRAQYEADLNEFKSIVEQANETSTLGGTFLGMNQGLPNTKADLQLKLKNIEKAMSDREKIFGVNILNLVMTDEQFSKATDKDLEKQRTALNKLIDRILKENVWLNRDDVKQTLIKVLSFGIPNNFSAKSWLVNNRIEGLKYNYVGGEKIELSFSKNPKYTALVSEYYNLIKSCWNIFDIMDKIPQFNEIKNLLNVVSIVDEVVSTKSKLVDKIQADIMLDTNYIDERQEKALIKYVDDLLITHFFDRQHFKISVPKGYSVFDKYNRTIEVKNDTTKCFLSSPEGRATFKMLMETKIFPAIKECGSWEGKITTLKNSKHEYVTIDGFKQNKFIQDLIVQTDSNGYPYLSLPIDMMNINATPSSSAKYNSYVNGFNKLKKYYIDGVSLTDWIILYNIITNLNQIGSDRLTTLLKPFMLQNKNTVMLKYFEFMGTLDDSELSEDFLSDLGYVKQDVLMRMANTVSSYFEYDAKGLFIKVINSDGSITYKQKNFRRRGYHTVSYYPQPNMDVDNDDLVSKRQKSNYLKYWTMPMKYYRQKDVLIRGLTSDDISDIKIALSTYSRDGIIKLFKLCK